MFSIDPKCLDIEELDQEYELRRDTEEYDPISKTEFEDDCRD